MMETDRYGLTPLHKQAFFPKYDPDDPHSSRVKQWMAGGGALGALGGGSLGALGSLQSSSGQGFKNRALDALASGGIGALAGGALGAFSSIPMGDSHGRISEHNEHVKMKKTLRELQQAQLQQAQAANQPGKVAGILPDYDPEHPYGSRLKQWMTGAGLATGALGAATGARQALANSQGLPMGQRIGRAVGTGALGGLVTGGLGSLYGLTPGLLHGAVSAHDETKKLLKQHIQQNQQNQAPKVAQFAAPLRPNDVEEQAVADACSHFKIAGGMGSLFGRGMRAAGNWVSKNPDAGLKGLNAGLQSIRPGMIGAGLGAVGGAAAGGEDHRFSGALKGGLAGGLAGGVYGGHKGWKQMGQAIQNNPGRAQPWLQGMSQVGQNFAQRGQQMMGR
jgi:hypothetical protein